MSINIIKSVIKEESLVVEGSSTKKPSECPQKILSIIGDYLQPKSSIKKKPKIDIAKHYDIVYQSKLINRPENAKVFLLAEEHGNEACKELNNKFIKQRATPGSSLLLESIPASIGVIKDKNYISALSEFLGLDRSLFETCQAQGWDFEQVNEFMNYCKGYLEIINSNQNEAQNLEAQRQLLLSGQTIEYTSQNTVRVVFGNTSADQEVIKKQNEILEKINICNEDVARYKILFDEFCLSYFPHRTKEMIKSVQNVSSLTKNGKIFLIAGIYHLKTTKSIQNEQRASLTELYETLDKYPAVVLVPKMLKDFL